MSINIENKIYIKIDDFWFDLTDYKEHPGGMYILKKYNLKDATEIFNNTKGHHDTFIDFLMNKFLITDFDLINLINVQSNQ